MSSEKYEIHVLNGKRWSIHSFKDTESAALEHARHLLKSRFCDVAKVIVDEIEIFSEDVNSIKKRAGITHLQDCSLMEKVEDLYSPKGRDILSRVFQEYLDQMILSPTELLHNHKKIEKLMDHSIMGSAMDHLAHLQSVKAGENEKERRDKIYGLFENALEKTRRSGFDDIDNSRLNQIITDLENFDDPEVQFRFHVSLATQTTRAPAWEAKFTILRDLLGKDFKVEELEDKTVSLCDQVMSEWLMMPTAIQEMLGQQPDRFNAMDVLVKLCIGAYEARKWDTPALEMLSRFMAKKPMSQCRTVVANRLEQMLRSRSSLTKGDLHDEKHAFKQLFPHFIGKSGTILGGEGMAEALTICATRSFNRDRNLEKPGDAITFMLDHLDAPILQLKFLLTLGNSRFGKDCADIICGFIPQFMEGPEHVHDIVHYKLPLKRKIRALTDLQKQAILIELPRNMNMDLVEWLDELLFNFLDEERIVDKMDSPDLTLFERTTTMLQFCASGLLIEGKTLNWVRERVQEHLKQPNFVEKFTEDVPTQKKKELVITQLHTMLQKAGLQA